MGRVAHQSVSDGFSITLFAYARLPNRNYFQIVAISAEGPPIPGPARRFVLRCAPWAVELKRDRKFQIGLGVVAGGEKSYRAGQRIFSFRPAFHIIARVPGHEFL